jgi:hypothetical protein
MKKIQILIRDEIWEQLIETFPELKNMEQQGNETALNGRMSAIIDNILEAEL